MLTLVVCNVVVIVAATLLLPLMWGGTKYERKVAALFTFYGTVAASLAGWFLFGAYYIMHHQF